MKVNVDVPEGGRQSRWFNVLPVKGHSKSEAKRKAKELIATLGINSDAAFAKASKRVVTFAEAVKVWQADYLTKMRLSTQSSTRPIINKHLLPRFGEMPMDEITAPVVRAFITDLVQNGALVPKSIHNVWKILKLILEQEERVTLTWKLNLPKIPYKEQRSFTQDEIIRIVDAAEGQYKLLFYLLGVTGLRPSESFALHVEDIWWDRGLIHCHRSMFQHIEGEVKTKAGYRNVPIDPQVVRLLRQHLNGRTSGRVFASRIGSPLVDGNVNVKHLRSLLKRLGMPHGTLHSFRHGRVSHLRQQGVPDSLVTKWIGHSSLRMTDHYTHYDAAFEQKIAAECGLLVPN
jgi:integrase